MGVKAQHIPGRNIGESIDRLVYDMETLLKDNAGVNLEQKGQQLFFNLWKCHQWGEYTLYYFPVKFVEELNPELKRIAISFINGMANANGIATILDGDETDMVLDWLETEEWDEPETETRNRLATVRSYRKGKSADCWNGWKEHPITRTCPPPCGNIPRRTNGKQPFWN